MEQVKVISVLVVLAVLLGGCASTVSIVSDNGLVYTGAKEEQPPMATFDWALMSQGRLMELTD